MIVLSHFLIVAIMVNNLKSVKNNSRLGSIFQHSKEIMVEILWAEDRLLPGLHESLVSITRTQKKNSA